MLSNCTKAGICTSWAADSKILKTYHATGRADLLWWRWQQLLYACKRNVVPS